MNDPISDHGLGGPIGDASVGPGPIEISVEAAGGMEAALAELVDDVELDFAAVLDDSGAVLGWATGGDGDDGDAAMVEAMVECSGALAMGAFAAAQTLAAQLGGEASREMIHHAGSKSFHLTEISAGVALFSVWSGVLALGYLRDSAARTVNLLQSEIGDLQLASSAGCQPERVPFQSPPIDFPSSPTAAMGSAEKRFPMPSRPGMAHGEDGRYVFEIG